MLCGTEAEVLSGAGGLLLLVRSVLACRPCASRTRRPTACWEERLQTLVIDGGNQGEPDLG